MVREFSRELLAKVKGATVLLTGSSGYIGSELARRFQENHIRFLGIDKDALLESGGELCQDLSDAKSTIEAIRSLEPDYVIHAGTHSALAYQDDLLGAFKDDATALTAILEALRQRPAARLIFFSSSYVYSGLDSSAPLPEEAILAPDHNFGVAKSFFEQLVSRTHANSVILRLSSVFGHGRPRHPNVIQNMAKDCLSEKELTLWGTGARRMQFIYLEDVIRFVIHSLSIDPGIYNLAGNEYESVSDTAKSIAEHLGARVSFLTEKREGRTLPFMENSKLRHACGGEEYTPFPEALRDLLNTFTRDHLVPTTRDAWNASDQIH